jgi:hypothetical protein
MHPMTEFQTFLTANMAAQQALRAEIQAFGKNPEFGKPSLSQLQTDLMALSVELNIRYMQEKLRAYPTGLS